MPRHSETRTMPYSCEQMFDLVADIRRYPEFLPWVSAMRVRSNDQTDTVADMIVGFKGLTRVIYIKRPQGAAQRNPCRLCRRAAQISS